VRAPLSWLRDFADFPDDIRGLTAALDDLGLVVEEVEHVGQGLESVVVSEVTEITPIEGADKIRRVVVEAGDGPLEIVLGVPEEIQPTDLIGIRVEPAHGEAYTTITKRRKQVVLDIYSWLRRQNETAREKPATA